MHTVSVQYESLLEWHTSISARFACRALDSQLSRVVHRSHEIAEAKLFGFKKGWFQKKKTCYHMHHMMMMMDDDDEDADDVGVLFLR